MAKRKTVWNGVEYPSLKEAARALQVTYDVLQNRLRKGYTSDADIENRKKQTRMKNSKSASETSMEQPVL